MHGLLTLLMFTVPGASAPGDEAWLMYVTKSGSGLQWRVLEAGSGRDVVLAVLPAAPENIFWTRDWGRVYYRLGATVHARAWRAGATPDLEAQVPAHLIQDLQEIWVDSATGRLMLSTMTLDAKAPPVPVGSPFWARIWERDPATGHWSRVAQEPTSWEAEGTLGPSVLDKHIRSQVHHVSDLSNDGGFQALEKQLRWLSGEPGGEGEVLLPAGSAKGRGLKLSVAWGDYPHLMAPVRYAAPAQPDRVVFAEGRCGARQVLIPRRADWVLIGDEHQLACPVLVNLRDGRARDLGMEVLLASWVVEPPKGDHTPPD